MVSMMQQSNPLALLGRTTHRRRYKKSTLGCGACKLRKIKCDEVRPVCGNCKRYYTDSSACQYGSHPRQPRAIVPTQQLTNLSVRPATLSSTNMLALRLMHHYSISFDVSQPFSSSPNELLARFLWKVEIPSIAFTSEPVLNALLGISAWHLWSLHPDDEQLITASRVYFGKALNLQRLALQQSDAQDLPPLLVTGIILAHLSWLLSHSDESADPQPSKLLGAYHLCRGYRSLTAKLSVNWSRYSFLYEGGLLEMPIQSSSHGKIMAQAAQDSRTLLDYIQNAEIDQKEKEVYYQVLREIWRVYTVVTDDCVDITTKEYTIVTCLHRVPLQFIRLFEREEPLALALMARAYAFLALLRKNSTAWYIHGDGKIQIYIRAIMGIQRMLTRDWLWIMDWPRRLISDVVLVSA